MPAADPSGDLETQARAAPPQARCAEQFAAAAPAAPVPLSRIECDRFCEHCGYNLFGQQVWRDPRLGLLVCRCPECGRHHEARDATTAGRLWLRRFGSAVVLGWGLTAVGLAAGLAGLQIAVHLGTLDELTTYARPGVVVPRNLIPHADLLLLLMYAASAGIGLAFALLLTLGMHHWRRAFYLPVVLGLPAVALLVAYSAWVLIAPKLGFWALPCIVPQAAACAGAGVVGVFCGRPLARCAAIVLLPPRLRQALAFLWTADGLPPPKVD